MRLAPFLLLAIAVLACGSPPPASAPVAPAGADVEDVSFEISALM